MPPSGLTKPSTPPQNKEKEIVKVASADNALLVFEPTELDWTAQSEKFQHCLMAHISNEVQHEVEEPFNCVSCINLSASLKICQLEVENLRNKVVKLDESNKYLKANEKLYDKQIEGYQFDTQKYKAKVYSQQDAIDSYLTEINLLNQELNAFKLESDNFSRKISSFTNSSEVFDEILSKQRTDTSSKAGLGYKSVPAPTNYFPLPVKEGTEELVADYSKWSATKSKEAAKPAKEKTKRSEYPLPVFVKSVNEPQVNCDEVVEIEDLTDMEYPEYKKVEPKPEKKVYEKEPVIKVQNEKKKEKVVIKNTQTLQTPVKILKRNEQVVFDIPSTSKVQPKHQAVKTCTNCACSKGASPAPPVRPQPQPVVETRSCFYCKKQGHLIRDCPKLSNQRFGRSMPRNSFYRNSFSNSPPRRYSNSPKPVKKPSNIEQKPLPIQKPDVTVKPIPDSSKVWKRKESSVDSSVVNNNTSDKKSDLFENKVLTDVVIVDDFGRPKSVKAWVTVSH